MPANPISGSALNSDSLPPGIDASLQAKQIQNAVSTAQSSSSNNDSLEGSDSHFGLWVAFQYALLFVTLNISLASIISVLRNFADYYMPSVQTGFGMISSSVNNYILTFNAATLVVVFPVFITMFLVTHLQAKDNPVIKTLKGRKVLIYIELIVTILIFISHLILLMFTLLNGTVKMKDFVYLLITLSTYGPVFVSLIIEVWSDRKV